MDSVQLRSTWLASLTPSKMTRQEGWRIVMRLAPFRCTFLNSRARPQCSKFSRPLPGLASARTNGADHLEAASSGQRRDTFHIAWRHEQDHGKASRHGSPRLGDSLNALRVCAARRINQQACRSVQQRYMGRPSRRYGNPSHDTCTRA
jgi:hypothetical protein